LCPRLVRHRLDAGQFLTWKEHVEDAVMGQLLGHISYLLQVFPRQFMFWVELQRLFEMGDRLR
jgi:hypothetical protein